MPIAPEIDDAALDKAIAAFGRLDANIITPEFRTAGEKVSTALIKDLRGGVASISGDLRSAITGEVKSVVGTDVDWLMSDAVQHRGYNYAARLNKDGSMRWRSGRFAGRRTFGWWSYTLKRVAPKITRREFRKAVINIINKLAGAMR